MPLPRRWRILQNGFLAPCRLAGWIQKVWAFFFLFFWMNITPYVVYFILPVNKMMPESQEEEAIGSAKVK
jgi:hypothetical protein